MGAVRADLLSLLDEVGDARQRVAFAAVWGLTEWPTVHVARPITARLAVERQRLGPDGRPRSELTPERVAQLAAAAVRVIDTDRARRSGIRAVRAGPVPDPSRSAWFATLVARQRRAWRPAMEAAVDNARLFVTRTGVSGAVEQVLAELDRYVHVLRSHAPARLDRPVATSRARALVGIAAWELLQESSPSRRHLQRPGPRSFGVLRPPPTFAPVAGVVSELLAGHSTDEVLSGCCREVGRLARRDRGAASVIVDLLLARYPSAGRPQISADTAARIMQTAVRLRSTDEDWTAIELVRHMTIRHPRSHRTLDALMYAVRVATAHSRWDVANEILGRMSAMLATGFAVPDGRVRAVETVEFRLWARHAQTATARRLLQEYGQRAAESAARTALAQQAAAIDDLEQALTLNATVGPGDANGQWRRILLIRNAELHIAASDLSTSADGARYRRRADTALSEAVEVGLAYPSVDEDQVAYLKARLSLSMRRGEDDEAAQLLTDLHEIHHWPLHRCIPEVSAVAAGRRHPLIRAGLHALVAELASIERDASWRPAVSPANRSRRASAR
jgi:hypothetical protein